MTGREEDIIDAEIVEEEAEPQDEISTVELSTNAHRTVAVITDANTSAMLLSETVVPLAKNYDVEKILVNLTTLAGRAIAEGAIAAGIPFAELDYIGAPEPNDPHITELRKRSDGKMAIDLEEIANLDANLVIAPASAKDMRQPHLVDLGPESLCALVFDKMRETEQPLLLINPPEAGLIEYLEPENYTRMLVLIGG